MADLVKSLKALTETADGEAPLTSSRVIGAGGRPTTAPYRSLPTDSQSMVSWSADAFGKSKTPGWYHTYRKELYAQRAARAAAQPSGCYISHSKYADEAKRITATGRLAFSLASRGEDAIHVRQRVSDLLSAFAFWLIVHGSSCELEQAGLSVCSSLCDGCVGPERVGALG